MCQLRTGRRFTLQTQLAAPKQTKKKRKGKNETKPTATQKTMCLHLPNEARLIKESSTPARPPKENSFKTPFSVFYLAQRSSAQPSFFSQCEVPLSLFRQCSKNKEVSLSLSLFQEQEIIGVIIADTVPRICIFPANSATTPSLSEKIAMSRNFGVQNPAR
jgi:hypothetical protein